MQDNADDNLYKVATVFLKQLSAPLLMDLEERDIPLRDFIEADDIIFRSITGKNPPPGLELSVRFEALAKARSELEFIRHHNIRILWFTDTDYPVRLAQIEYPPPCLFCLGNCNLNDINPVSIVGTRRMTPYGADMAKKIIRELASFFPQLLVVSGLAFGIDSVGHKTALEEKRHTVGVVAHGLDMIYPAQHRDLAKRIIEEGGAILSQYPSGTRPYRNNFLERNRIIAGCSDATIIVESEIKGGAMSTARHALDADREVLAVPGRISDPMSAGCNKLIQTNRAKLITSAADVIEETGWHPEVMGMKQEKSIFPELDGEQKIIYDSLIQNDEPMQLDSICHSTRIPIGRLMVLLNELEFDGLLIRHPGNRFSLSYNG